MIRERILVIGGTGRIGRQVTSALARTPHDVAVCHRGTTHDASIPSQVLHFHAQAGELPLVSFPSRALTWAPTIVVHMICMGAPDANACVSSFAGIARRCVLVSSGDVYAVFGRFRRLESGPADPSPQTEGAALRSVLFPYRSGARQGSLQEWYEKQLAERQIVAADWETVVLRLPKVYGPGINQDLASIYDHARHPNWRWTHGYSINVAAAIALAALHPAAAGRVYNVGEEQTPTIAQRLAQLPSSPTSSQSAPDENDYAHDIVLDTQRIRHELGYREVLPEDVAARSTLASR